MHKFICSILIFTLLMLSYISQQVKLVEYSYCVNNNRKQLCLLVDQNKGLRYNVANLESPVRLQQRLASNNIKLDIPDKYNYVRLAKLAPDKPGSNKAAYEQSFKIAAKMLLNAFTPKAEAIAQELNQP